MMSVKKISDFENYTISLGPVYITQVVKERMDTFGQARCVVECILRYCDNDFGIVDEADTARNQEYIEKADGSGSIVGCYDTAVGRVCIITQRISENSGDVGTFVFLAEENKEEF